MACREGYGPAESAQQPIWSHSPPYLAPRGREINIVGQKALFSAGKGDCVAFMFNKEQKSGPTVEVMAEFGIFSAFAEQPGLVWQRFSEAVMRARVHTNLDGTARLSRESERQQNELLRRRAGLLVGSDRLLMMMYLDRGASVRQLARLAGVTEAAISRRINRLIMQLTAGKYITCLRNRSRFSTAQIQVARAYFLQGLSMRQIAESRNCTYYRIGQMVKTIRKIIEQINEKESKAREQGKSKKAKVKKQ